LWCSANAPRLLASTVARPFPCSDETRLARPRLVHPIYPSSQHSPARRNMETSTCIILALIAIFILRPVCFFRPRGFDPRSSSSDLSCMHACMHSSQMLLLDCPITHFVSPHVGLLDLDRISEMPTHADSYQLFRYSLRIVHRSQKPRARFTRSRMPQS
jgi:hypothetical protein